MGPLALCYTKIITMHPNQNLQYLSFFRLEYALDQVRHWLHQDIDCFVFDSYFPATEDPNRPLYLCCFAQKEGTYLNAYQPDLLMPYAGEILQLAGPIKLTANLVTADAMKDYLHGLDDEDNFLVFTPAMDAHGQVYYTISALQHTDTGDMVDTDGGTINSNPSPPATAMTAVKVD